MVAPTARDSMSFGSILRANYTETLGRAGRDHKIGNRIFFDRNLLRQSVLVQLRQGRPPAIFPRFEISADERRLAVQNSVSVLPRKLQKPTDTPLNRASPANACCGRTFTREISRCGCVRATLARGRPVSKPACGRFYISPTDHVLGRPQAGSYRQANWSNIGRRLE